MRTHTRTLAFAKTGGALLLAGALTLGLTGCSAGTTAATTAAPTTEARQEVADTTSEATTDGTPVVVSDEATIATAALTTGGIIDTTDLFTERDLTQTADTTNAQHLTVASGEDLQISEEGVYVISGEATETTICVEVDDSSKVQLVLDGVSITNASKPVIYVKNADKVFVTTTEGSTNTLRVSDSFVADGETNTDAVVFSKDDLVLNGLGTLVIESSDNGISCKDDLKVTGGSYQITSAGDAIEANDAIAIADGSFAITSSKDGLHAENDEDDTQGSIYLCGGSFAIEAASDAIQATTYLQVDGGSYDLHAGEALEATYVQVNGGTLNVSASDDGVNASYKSSAVGTPTIEITGGQLSIAMAAGDTDALDVNGNLIVSGGSIDISAQSPFDFDGTASFTGGSIVVNGEQVSEITNSMMGGGMGGGPMGAMGEMGGQPGGGMMGGMGPRG